MTSSPDLEFTGEEGSSFKADADELHQTLPSQTSPDSKCPICLETFDSMFHLNPCSHTVCLPCIQEQSQTKSERPPCKQPFQSICHSAEDEEGFKEYVFMPSKTHSLSNPLWRKRPYHTSLRKEDNTTGVHCLNRSSLSHQTWWSPPTLGSCSGHAKHQGDQRIHEVAKSFAKRRQISADQAFLSRVYQDSGMQTQEACHHRDFSGCSQMPSLMKMIGKLGLTGLLLFLCFYLYFTFILLYK